MKTSFFSILRSIHKSATQGVRTVRSTTAETLAEVLIAFIVLSVGGTGAIVLMNGAINANSEGETRIVAYNLAREGVEAIRNIRDTNWLRHSVNRYDCWDVTLDTTDPTQCIVGLATKIGSTFSVKEYIVWPEIDDTSKLFSWNIESISATTDITLYEGDVNGSVVYVHDPTGSLSLDATPFSRVISIEKSDEYPIGAPDGRADTMVVTSTVTWEYKGKERSIVFVDELTNY